jgi:cell division protein FtsB
MARTRRRSAIRWDRVGRYALLGVLGVILLLYVSPAKRWIDQSATAGHQQAELEDLQEEHDQLRARLRALKAPGALERQARRLGMVKAGERSFVIENLGR